jgi:hypothetical protein
MFLSNIINNDNINLLRIILDNYFKSIRTTHLLFLLFL